jgi:hypothetical protein
MVRIKVPGGKDPSSHGLMVRYVASRESTGNALANFPSRFNLQNILLFLLSHCESLFHVWHTFSETFVYGFAGAHGETLQDAESRETEAVEAETAAFEGPVLRAFQIIFRFEVVQ